tara:strand:+ start:23 stop:784 length:762 start_codon:yes stop_codon:yes gene_type:complete
MIKNYIYKGSIRHRRFTPVMQSFNYSIFMTFFDINKIESIFKKSILWNVNKFGLMSFQRKDYHGDPNISLDSAVRQTIYQEKSIKIEGPIRILTHLRYFGYCFNPVSFYYCYNKNDTKVQIIMAEVTNTPWNERHTYFIDSKKNNNFLEHLDKEFHVSPFWDMDHKYEWYFTSPTEKLFVNMKNFKSKQKVFDVVLDLNQRIEMNFYNLLLHTLTYPFLTLMVYLRIHYQALKLWLRGVKYVDHPKYKQDEGK